MRSTETFAADLLNPPTPCPAAAAALALPWLASRDGGRSLALSRCLWCCIRAKALIAAVEARKIVGPKLTGCQP